ncbi:MAG TPA: hypothetical protein VMS77_01220 [Conexivisphaerales archaeon]|nr:hypothetical protein [Conexivisphaerales archaeon]
MPENQDEVTFATDVRTDMNKYRDALVGILRDVYMARPEMAPRVHSLIYRCDGVIALTNTLESNKIGLGEAKELIGKKVGELMRLTEDFLEDLSETMDETKKEPYFEGAAS